ncbi:hypothetical protein [Cupriavidus necator]
MTALVFAQSRRLLANVSSFSRSSFVSSSAFRVISFVAHLVSLTPKMIEIFHVHGLADGYFHQPARPPLPLKHYNLYHTVFRDRFDITNKKLAKASGPYMHEKYDDPKGVLGSTYNRPATSRYALTRGLRIKLCPTPEIFVYKQTL